MRGVKPTTAIEEVQRCAMKMGYHWVKNTVADLPFDAFMFRPAVFAVVKLKKSGTRLRTMSSSKKNFLMK